MLDLASVSFAPVRAKAGCLREDLSATYARWDAFGESGSADRKRLGPADVAAAFGNPAERQQSRFADAGGNGGSRRAGRKPALVSHPMNVGSRAPKGTAKPRLDGTARADRRADALPACRAPPSFEGGFGFPTPQEPGPHGRDDVDFGFDGASKEDRNSDPGGFVSAWERTGPSWPPRGDPRGFGLPTAQAPGSHGRDAADSGFDGAGEEGRNSDPGGSVSARERTGPLWPPRGNPRGPRGRDAADFCFDGASEEDRNLDPDGFAAARERTGPLWQPQGNPRGFGLPTAQAPGSHGRDAADSGFDGAGEEDRNSDPGGSVSARERTGPLWPPRGNPRGPRGRDAADFCFDGASEEDRNLDPDGFAAARERTGPLWPPRGDPRGFGLPTPQAPGSHGRDAADSGFDGAGEGDRNSDPGGFVPARERTGSAWAPREDPRLQQENRAARVDCGGLRLPTLSEAGAGAAPRRAVPPRASRAFSAAAAVSDRGGAAGRPADGGDPRGSRSGSGAGHPFRRRGAAAAAPPLSCGENTSSDEGSDDDVLGVALARRIVGVTPTPADNPGHAPERHTGPQDCDPADDDERLSASTGTGVTGGRAPERGAARRSSWTCNRKKSDLSRSGSEASAPGPQAPSRAPFAGELPGSDSNPPPSNRAAASFAAFSSCRDEVAADPRRSGPPPLPSNRTSAAVVHSSVRGRALPSLVSPRYDELEPHEVIAASYSDPRPPVPPPPSCSVSRLPTPHHSSSSGTVSQYRYDEIHQHPVSSTVCFADPPQDYSHSSPSHSSLLGVNPLYSASTGRGYSGGHLVLKKKTVEDLRRGWELSLELGVHNKAAHGRRRWAQWIRRVTKDAGRRRMLAPAVVVMARAAVGRVLGKYYRKLRLHSLMSYRYGRCTFTSSGLVLNDTRFSPRRFDMSPAVSARPPHQRFSTIDSPLNLYRPRPNENVLRTSPHRLPFADDAALARVLLPQHNKVTEPVDWSSVQHGDLEVEAARIERIAAQEAVLYKLQREEYMAKAVTTAERRTHGPSAQGYYTPTADDVSNRVKQLMQGVTRRRTTGTPPCSPPHQHQHPPLPPTHAPSYTDPTNPNAQLPPASPSPTRGLSPTSPTRPAYPRSPASGFLSRSEHKIPHRSKPVFEPSDRDQAGLALWTPPPSEVYAAPF
ncbi:hypothetical protein DIPPA_14001 [Diplonema papillatum]|nr:hypothetical protein DIPPA_14001 [Diplonema papillatum]